MIAYRFSIGCAIAFAFAFAFALAACGDGAFPEGYQPPLAVLHGAVDDPTGAAVVRRDQLRIALVWDGNPRTQLALHLVVADAPIAARGALSFTIAIADPPPAAAMVADDADPTVRTAVGHVVVYRDLDGNHQLDFTPLDGDHFVDELYAYDPTTRIVYTQRDGGDFALEQVTPYGESADIDAALVLYTGVSDQPSCNLLEWAPRAAYARNGFLWVGPFQGNQGPWDRLMWSECPDDAPPPPTERLTCTDVNGTHDVSFLASWTLPTSAWVAATCGPVLRTCRRALDRDQPPPETWPCPCVSGTTGYQCVSYWNEL